MERIHGIGIWEYRYKFIENLCYGNYKKKKIRKQIRNQWTFSVARSDSSKYIMFILVRMYLYIQQITTALIPEDYPLPSLLANGQTIRNMCLLLLANKFLSPFLSMCAHFLELLSEFSDMLIFVAPTSNHSVRSGKKHSTDYNQRFSYIIYICFIVVVAFVYSASRKWP